MDESYPNWKRITTVMDSGAWGCVAPPSVAPKEAIEETAKSRNGTLDLPCEATSNFDVTMESACSVEDDTARVRYSKNVVKYTTRCLHGYVRRRLNTHGFSTPVQTRRKHNLKHQNPNCGNAV